MKTIYPYIILIFTTLSCKNTIKPAHAGIKVKPAPIDSFPANNLDQLEVKDSNLYLKASKDKNGVICLRYQFNLSNTNKAFSFQYFDYSEVVFPDTSIGVIAGGSLRKSNYFLIRDSILILPLIGMNNFLSVYVLNLKSQQVLGDDMRTSLSLVWIDEKNSTFLIADTPSYIDDTTYLYNVNKYKIMGTKLSWVKSYSASLGVDLKDDLNANYKMVRRFLKSKLQEKYDIMEH